MTYGRDSGCFWFPQGVLLRSTHWQTVIKIRIIQLGYWDMVLFFYTAPVGQILKMFPCYKQQREGKISWLQRFWGNAACCLLLRLQAVHLFNSHPLLLLSASYQSHEWVWREPYWNQCWCLCQYYQEASTSHTFSLTVSSIQVIRVAGVSDADLRSGGHSRINQKRPFWQSQLFPVICPRCVIT